MKSFLPHRIFYQTILQMTTQSQVLIPEPQATSVRSLTGTQLQCSAWDCPALNDTHAQHCIYLLDHVEVLFYCVLLKFIRRIIPDARLFT